MYFMGFLAQYGRKTINCHEAMKYIDLPLCLNKRDKLRQKESVYVFHSFMTVGCSSTIMCKEWQNSLHSFLPAAYLLGPRWDPAFSKHLWPGTAPPPALSCIFHSSFLSLFGVAVHSLDMTLALMTISSKSRLSSGMLSILSGSLWYHISSVCILMLSEEHMKSFQLLPTKQVIPHEMDESQLWASLHCSKHSPGQSLIGPFPLSTYRLTFSVFWDIPVVNANKGLPPHRMPWREHYYQVEWREQWYHLEETPPQAQPLLYGSDLLNYALFTPTLF